MRILSSYNNELKQRGFNAFKIEEDADNTRIYSRKDFYKICLTTGKSHIHYADRSFAADGTVLFFGNPNIPYSWETLSRTCVGYTCLFSKDFLTADSRSESLQQSPLFKLGGTPILEISEEQRLFLNELFQKMIIEQQSEYEHKDEIIRTYINLILHESLKLKPAEKFSTNKNAATRLTSVFMDLLDRQFPIESSKTPLQLKTAKDYAKILAVHVNSLNRAVKEVTGKSTTSHISEHIINEAKAMLKYTTWQITEIAYALGFEYPTYFNLFFKKHTGKTPSELRK